MPDLDAERVEWVPGQLDLFPPDPPRPAEELTMGDRTAIEWTEATWNPVTGCTKVSPGCDLCYAEAIAHRFAGTPAYPNGFAVTLRPERLSQPLRWTRPRRIFVCSMADLFHDDVPDEHIARVWAVMALARQHTFQVLTKRHGRMRSLLSASRFQDLLAAAWFELPRDRRGSLIEWPLPNVWLGVSAEDQKRADLRIPALLDTPAEVRWVSAEPLLGPLDLDQPRCDAHGRREVVTDGHGREWCGFCADDGFTGELSFGHWLDPLNGGIGWVVAGGESGRGARPMHPGWARSLRDQCDAAGVAFLFKQWGEWAPLDGDPARGDVWAHGDVGTTAWAPDTAGAAAGRWGPHADVLMRRTGKKAAGRELDGRTHDGYPDAAAVTA